MANWDHYNNIGTHPVLSTDPEVRLPAVIEAADREITKFKAIKAEAERELTLLRLARLSTVGRGHANS